jgi:hypothetical protein
MPDLSLPTEFSRRTSLRLLGIATVGLLAGCRRSSDHAAPVTPSRAPSPTPAGAGPSSAASSTLTAAPTPAVDPVVARAAAAEKVLLLAYDSAALAHPELASVLTPLRADHAAHLRGLLPAAATTPAAITSRPITSPNVANSNPVASTAPSDLVLGQLASLEHAAAAARLTDVAATSGSLARLLASIGGCEAAHAALLVGT